MKIDKKIICTYICEVCGAEYKKIKECEECERLPVPEPAFKIGDELVVKGETRGIFLKKPMMVKITEVFGPYPPYPLADNADLPYTIKPNRVTFPTMFFHMKEKYIKSGFVNDRHIYFYQADSGGKYIEYYFEEELEPAKREGEE